MLHALSNSLQKDSNTLISDHYDTHLKIAQLQIFGEFRERWCLGISNVEFSSYISSLCKPFLAAHTSWFPFNVINSTCVWFKTWIIYNFSIKKKTPPFWPRKGPFFFKDSPHLSAFPPVSTEPANLSGYPEAQRRVWRIEQVTRWSVPRTPWIPPNGKAWMERNPGRRPTKGWCLFFVFWVGFGGTVKRLVKWLVKVIFFWY